MIKRKQRDELLIELGIIIEYLYIKYNIPSSIKEQIICFAPKILYLWEDDCQNGEIAFKDYAVSIITKKFNIKNKGSSSMRSFKLFKRKSEPHTRCYCPKCRNELVSSNSFVEDVDGIVKYRCDYCMGAKPLVTGNTNDRGIVIQYPNRLMAYGYDVHGCGSNGLSVKIKYCPTCGRKLKKGDQNGVGFRDE